MRIHRFSITPLAFALLLATITVASHGQGRKSDPIFRLKTISLLLAESQCDKVLPGYSVKISPYYQAWRNANFELVSDIESTDNFNQQKARMLQQLPHLSDRAKIGLKKDCASMLTTLASEYRHPQAKP